MLEQRAVLSAQMLDRFALTACQHYNFGNTANWFFSFRGGYFGVMSRVRGLHQHSRSLHEWSLQETRLLSHQEHDIATMLFCMDSALECFVFMLNALGQAVDKPGFRDVASDSGLRRIGPDDILGARKPPLDGYLRYFPSLQSYWARNSVLVAQIFENHDVTKHRQQAGITGTSRLDAPLGFYEALGLPDDPLIRATKGPAPPMKTVLVPKRPKLPIDQRPLSNSEWISLEEIEREFYTFIGESFCLGLQDAQKTIVLNDSTLHP